MVALQTPVSSHESVAPGRWRYVRRKSWCVVARSKCCAADTSAATSARQGVPSPRICRGALQHQADLRHCPSSALQAPPAVAPLSGTVPVRCLRWRLTQPLGPHDARSPSRPPSSARCPPLFSSSCPCHVTQRPEALPHSCAPDLWIVSQSRADEVQRVIFLRDVCEHIFLTLLESYA